MIKTKGYVISLGGSSIFNAQGVYNEEFLKKLSFLKKNKNIILVVGGGIKARNAIAKLKSKNNFDRDIKGIYITHENAKYVAEKVGMKYYDLIGAKDICDIPQGAVVGGILPCLTTDAVAALIAEQKGYKFVNTTNVDGVYTKDPKKHKDAKFLKNVEINELIKIVFNSDKREPGTNTVLDLISLLIVRRSKIPCFICKATQENLQAILNNKKLKGTAVYFR